MSYECDDALAFITGLVIGAGIILGIIYHNSAPTELECREGKLFEVTHEGNITIYDPTYDECKVTK